jgi:hypothetical protein
MKENVGKSGGNIAPGSILPYHGIAHVGVDGVSCEGWVELYTTLTRRPKRALLTQ